MLGVSVCLPLQKLLSSIGILKPIRWIRNSSNLPCLVCMRDGKVVAQMKYFLNVIQLHASKNRVLLLIQGIHHPRYFFPFLLTGVGHRCRGLSAVTETNQLRLLAFISEFGV